MSDDSVGHMAEAAPGAWSFDASVTEVFEDMLRRSIPQYDVMRDLTLSLGLRHVQRNTAIIDLGSSRGDALDPYVQKCGARNHYVATDVSEPMLDVMRERWKNWLPGTGNGLVDVLEWDLRDGVPQRPASLVQSVLTLQFVPINYRHTIIASAFDALVPGGAFLLVEKVLGSDSQMDAMLVDEYHQLKHRNGYSLDSIEAKRTALEGVLVPLTAEWNEEALRRAGFTHVECVWRCLSFGAWIAVK